MSPADEAAGKGDEGIVEFGAALPADGEALELMEEGEGLLDDVAELAQPFDVRAALAGDDRQDPAFAEFAAVGVGVVALVSEEGLRVAGGGMPSTRARVWVTSLTLAAVVMTLSGVPRPSQIRRCLLPVFRRSTGDGPVPAPPFRPGRGNRRRMLWTSPARRPRAAWRAGRGAVGQRLRPAASARSAASRSGQSRTPAQGGEVARRCRCTGRRGCPAGTAGPARTVDREPSRVTAAGAVRSAPTGHRPRPTAG